MRRLPLLTLTLTVTLAPALVVLPTVSRPAPAAEPVPPLVRTLALAGVDAGALRAARTLPAPGVVATFADVLGAAATRPAVLTPPLTPAATGTPRFDLVALSWQRPEPATRAQVRVREGGVWTAWQDLASDDDGPDGGREGSPSAAGATAPLLTGGADGVQVRVDTASGRAPAGLRVDLVDGGRAAADAPAAAPAGSAVAATTQPRIITRRQWGADERLVTGTPVLNRTVRALFVHHTDTANSYSAAQAYAQVRAVYAFHTRVRGWNDIGYNFLVDRFGRVFEGRRGSITSAVMGAHTGGFNTDSLGVAVLGTFTTQVPSRAALDALAGVLAWKAAQYGIDPRAPITLTSAGGSFTRYPAGTRVRLPALSAHRDVGSTECPGDALYGQLPRLRREVATRLAPGLVGPVLSAPSALWSGAPVVLDAAVPTTQTWTMTVTPACGGAPVRTLTGRATGRLTAGWDLRDAAGVPVPPGLYRVAVDTRSPVGAVPTWTTTLEVLPTDGAPAGSCPVRRVPAAEGADAVARAVAVGHVVAPTATTVVLVGAAAATTDGVVAAPLAHALGAPLLLTDRATLSPAVAADLAGRHATRVIVIGGSRPVSPAVTDALRALGLRVDRLAGATAAGTAAALAGTLAALPSGPGTGPAQAGNGAVLVVATRTGLADAVTAGAAAAATGRPVLLLTPRGVPAETAAALRMLGVTSATVVADPAVVPDSALRGLKALGVRSWTRVIGSGRAGTALALARTWPADPPAAPGDAWVAAATDAALPDAVAAAAAGRPVLLVPGVVTAGLTDWFTRRRPRATWVLGGSAQIPAALLADLTTLPTLPTLPTNQKVETR
jgi:putative cell wall-binding protein